MRKRHVWPCEAGLPKPNGARYVHTPETLCFARQDKRTWTIGAKLLTRMHAEIPAAAVTPHADTTCSDEPEDRIQQLLNSSTQEIKRLLKLVSLTKRRPTLPALQVTASPSTARPTFEMPPPVIFSRKSKANAGPRRCKN